MLRTVVKLLVLAAIVVTVLQYGLPAWRRSQGGTAGSGFLMPEPEAGPAACLDAGERSSEAVGEVAYEYSPGDLADWRAAEEEAQQVIAAARELCTCPETACRRVEQALDELDGVLAAFRNMMDTRDGGFVNPASAHERASNLLLEARALLE